MSMFNQPSSGGGFFKPAEFNGHLILVTKVHGFDRHFDKLKGQEIDRATVDYVNLTGDGKLVERAWMTHPGLVNKLSIGKPTLGRIGQVPADKGPAWSLTEFAEGSDDVAAERWVAANPTSGTYAQPAAPALRPAVPAPAYAAPYSAPIQAAPVQAVPPQPAYAQGGYVGPAAVQPTYALTGQYAPSQAYAPPADPAALAAQREAHERVQRAQAGSPIMASLTGQHPVPLDEPPF